MGRLPRNLPDLYPFFALLGGLIFGINRPPRLYVSDLGELRGEEDSQRLVVSGKATSAPTNIRIMPNRISKESATQMSKLSQSPMCERWYADAESMWGGRYTYHLAVTASDDRQGHVDRRWLRHPTLPAK